MAKLYSLEYNKSVVVGIYFLNVHADAGEISAVTSKISKPYAFIQNGLS